MARLARVVAAGIPHHITQRGNARRFILDCDSDRKVYIDLLKENFERSKVSLLGYCLMSNHVHLVAVPATVDGLAQALKRTHARYASYWNALHGSSGHAWQGRSYSCPMGETHLWEALRYTELNPVRARACTNSALPGSRPVWVHRRISFSLDSISPAARHWLSNYSPILPNPISRSALPLRSALPRWEQRGHTPSPSNAICGVFGATPGAPALGTALLMDPRSAK
jgi:REP element-mobilizing transposase RayT